MRVLSVVGAALLAAPLASAGVIGTREELNSSLVDERIVGGVLQSDVLAGAAAVNQKLYQATSQPKQWEKCNSFNIVYRREWSTFTTSEKKNYISAVQCISKLPSKTPKEKCPGCRNRYDDFLGTHINQTFYVHNTGNFLVWHRYFTWAYEQTLREECGYKGHHPYYNWARWSDDPSKSPALDGSALSLGGNGLGGDRCTNQTFYGIPTQADPLIKVPHGAGGGCVNSGPFNDWQVNLGPVFTDLTCTPPNPYSDFSDPAQTSLIGLGYNPRCLKRDISAWTSRQWTNDQQVTTLMKSKDIKTFWYNMQGGENAFSNNFMGVHTGGHFTIGGDPGSDFFASPGDPWFYMHHSQIDRTWWTWQNQKPAERTKALYGTTFIADPTAPGTTLKDSMNLGYAYPGTITIEDAMSTMAGPFCYTYV